MERQCWRLKQVSLEAEDRPLGGRTIGPEDPKWLHRYVGPRPEVTIRINGVPLTALLDTGLQVTTIQKPTFEK